jgi:protein O-mannosyl-transferase
MNVAERSRQPFHSSPNRREFLSLRLCLLAILALVGVVFALYSPALDFQFILDDHRFTQDHRIQFSGYIWDYFSNFVWAQSTGMPPSFYRPVFLLWMRINYLLCGLSPWGWHLLSIAKHVLVAALLGLLVWTLLRDRMAALIAAALFALHPAQTESVAWVTVPDPLMSAAILGSLLLYFRYARSDYQERSRGAEKRKKGNSIDHAKSGGRTRWLIASAICSLIALFAKETAILLPAVIFAAALVHIRTRHTGLLREKTKPSERSPGTWVHIKAAIASTIPFLLVAVIYFALRINALDGKISSRTQHLPVSTILLSWPATLWFYLKVLLWPARSRSFADPTVVVHFSVRDVLLPALGILTFSGILLVIVLWIWKRARRSPSPEQAEGLQTAVILGILLLVLPLLLTLDLNALNPGDFLHGRYTYLPLCGLTLLVGAAWSLSGKLRIPLLLLCGMVAVACSVLTRSQEKQWSDDLTVFTVAHDQAPHNVPVARNLADARIRQALLTDPEGKCEQTMPLSEQVTRDFPDDWFAWAAMGNCWVQRNDLSHAEEAFHRAVDLSHDPSTTQEWQQLRAQLGLPVLSPSTN